jgi:formate dehydrogenase maturation protein FdhE
MPRSTHASNPAAEARTRLERLAHDLPALAAPARILADLIETAWSISEPPPHLLPNDVWPEIRQAWNQGAALLQSVRLPWDPDRIRRRVSALVDQLARSGVPGADACQSLHQAQPDLLKEWAIQSVSGGDESVARQILGRELPGATIALILRLAVLPSLELWNRSHAEQLLAITWQGRDCPVCACPAPVIAEDRGLEKTRIVRCLRCAAGWPEPRGRCTACGRFPDRAIPYLSMEDQETRLRAALCTHCGHRLRIVTTLGPLPAPELLAVELESAHLEFLPFPAPDNTT